MLLQPEPLPDVIKLGEFSVIDVVGIRRISDDEVCTGVGHIRECLAGLGKKADSLRFVAVSIKCVCRLLRPYALSVEGRVDDIRGGRRKADTIAGLPVSSQKTSHPACAKPP